jgi:hypothetical protein
VQPFWQSGYGYVDAKAAYDLISRHRYNRNALTKLQSSADTRVLGDRDYKTLSTDYWTFPAAAATVDGTPDNKNYTITVTTATKAIKALVSYPSLSYVGVNEFDYHLTLTDAGGTVVAESTASASAGTSDFFVDLTKASHVYGAWNLNVRGDLGAQDQGVIMGSRVSVTLAQLAPQLRVRPTMPSFTASGSATYYFQPGAAGVLTSPEGCNLQAGAPAGGLAPAKSLAPCQSGSMGYAVNYGAGIPAIFNGAPLAAPLTVGGNVTLKFYLTDPAQPAWVAAQNPRLDLEIDAIDANGDLIAPVGSGEWTVCDDNGNCNTGLTPVGGTYTVQIPPITLPAGSRLSIVVSETGAVASASRTVYGGTALTANFSDAGVMLTTGTLK